MKDAVSTIKNLLITLTVGGLPTLAESESLVGGVPSDSTACQLENLCSRGSNTVLNMKGKIYAFPLK